MLSYETKKLPSNIHETLPNMGATGRNFSRPKDLNDSELIDLDNNQTDLSLANHLM